VLDLVSPAHQLFLASHERDGETTHLATPMQLLAPPVEDVPGDARAEVDEAFAARGWETLFEILPWLGSTPGVSFTQ
jgi:hypothetical protein